MYKLISVLRAALAALGLASLAACGGGDDDDSQRVPAGAKVCELRMVPGGSLFPRYDLQTEAVIPGHPGEFLLKPAVSVSEDLLFTIGILFPGSPPQPEGRRYTFYVQQILHHAGDTPRFECVLTGLQRGDEVIIRGGKEKVPTLFIVVVNATFQMSDGRILASEAEQIWIEY